MRHALFRREPAAVPKASSASERWRRPIRRIVCVVLVGAALAGCDRCGDLAVPGMTACRQEAPKPR